MNKWKDKFILKFNFSPRSSLKFTLLCCDFHSEKGQEFRWSLFSNKRLMTKNYHDIPCPPLAA